MKIVITYGMHRNEYPRHGDRAYIEHAISGDQWPREFSALGLSGNGPCTAHIPNEQ